jgi:bifunctional DNase/RNase
MGEMLSAEIWTLAQTSQGCAILLRPLDLGIAVPIFIGQLEMQSIVIGKEGVSLPRPLTHDLFLSLLRRMKLKLERVEVYELKSSTFHARLVISGGEFTQENPLVIDCRPSDAFGLAVRKKCPLFIDSTVVEQTGIPLEFFIDAMENGDNSFMEEKHRKLLEQLNQAVASEEYERAAEIRDILNLLNRDNEPV